MDKLIGNERHIYRNNSAMDVESKLRMTVLLSSKDTEDWETVIADTELVMLLKIIDTLRASEAKLQEALKQYAVRRHWIIVPDTMRLPEVIWNGDHDLDPWQIALDALKDE